MKTSRYFISFLILIFVINKNVYSQQTKILILLPENYGANYHLNRDNFENFGWEVVVAGTSNNITPCPVYAQPLGCPAIVPDILVSEIIDISNYDCITIMSGSHWAGNPCGDFISNTTTIKLIQEAVKKNIPVAAWCTGVRVLAAAAVISGKNVTGNRNYSNEYSNAGANYLGKNILPVIDGNIITCSAGDHYNKQNCNAILEILNNFIAKYQNLSDKLNSTDQHNDGGKSIIHTSSDSLIASGYTFSQGNGKSDVLIIKSDSLGNSSWQRTFGGSGWDYSNSIIETSDNNFISVGFTTSFTSKNVDGYAIKIDRNGNLIWEKTFGGENWDIFNSVCQDNNDNLYICGYTESLGSGEDDIYLVKINTDGNIIWEKTFGTTNSEMGFKIIHTSDNNLLVIGNTGKFVSSGDRDIYAIKINLDGAILWEQTYTSRGSNTYHERGVDIIELSEGGYLIIGSHAITYNDVSNIIVLKTNSEGKEIWRKDLGESSYYDYGIAALELNNEYLVAGVTKSTTHNNDVIFYHLNSNGQKINTKKFTHEGNSWISSMVYTNNKVIYTGHNKSEENSSLDFMLSEYIIDRGTNTNTNKLPGKEPLKVFPIPANNHLNVTYNLEDNEYGYLDIINVQGQIVHSFGKISGETKTKQWSIDGNLNEGVYYCRLRIKNMVSYKKFLIVK